jgi:hypothetical protein
MALSASAIIRVILDVEFFWAGSLLPVYRAAWNRETPLWI